MKRADIRADAGAFHATFAANGGRRCPPCAKGLLAIPSAEQVAKFRGILKS